MTLFQWLYSVKLGGEKNHICCCESD